MYEWLVAQIGVGGALGLAFGSLAVLFLLVIGGLAWQIYRLKKAYTLTNTSEMILHNDAQLNIAPSDEDEIRGDNLPHRLTLCDSVTIDNERRIILVRRDDVEHLIMIGGAGDMIIEHNIPVDVPSLDPVSMLAIAQVEAEALINESTIHEKAQTQPLVEEDATSTLPEEEIHTKSQEQDQEIIESKSEDSPSSPSLVHESMTDEKIVQTDSTMASLFPGRMGSPAMPAPQEEPNQQDAQASQDKQNNGLQDPPVASYFANQPKRVEPIQKSQNDTTDRSNIEPLSITPQEHAPIKDQQNTPPRILPLNPFFHASSPLKKPDNIPPATPSVTPAQPQPQTHSSNLPPKITENQIAAPETATPPEPQGLFINSFLGFPLQQLVKPASDLTPPAPTPPLIKTYGQPTSPTLLKKSNS